MDEKRRQKYRADAAKLSQPKPQELPSGSWRCELLVKGERISVVDEDPAVAHAKALALKAGIIRRNEEEAQARRGNITLTKAIDAYITARQNVLSPSTLNGYREIQRNRLQSIMDKQVFRITASDIQSAVSQDAKTVSAKTLKNALALIGPVINEYQSVDLSKVRLPQRKRKEHAYLDEAGLIDFFDAIRGDLVELPLLLGVWLGMRRSEIMGLCWDCIDFDRGIIKIHRTYVRQEDGQFALREGTKTEASRRELPCPYYILSKLRDYTPRHRTGRVFNMHPNTLWKNMKKICEAHGIDFVGIHGLRHTNASVMLSLGILDKVAMARGGWSTDVTMKQVYQHVFQSDVTSADEKMDAFFQAIASGQLPQKQITHEITHKPSDNI